MVDSDREGRLLTVRGRVQGVGFRAWAARRGLALGLTGWIRNRADGSVECLACGPSEVLDRFATALHQGPPLARVDQVDARPVAVEGGAGFEIR